MNGMEMMMQSMFKALGLDPAQILGMVKTVLEGIEKNNALLQRVTEQNDEILRRLGAGEPTPIPAPEDMENENGN